MLELRPELPIILCTGFSDAVDAQRARALGIRAFHYKPLTRETLAATLRDLLAPREDPPLA